LRARSSSRVETTPPTADDPTADETLRQSLQQLEAIYRALPDTIVVLDAADIVRSVKFAPGREPSAPPERYVGQSIHVFAAEVDLDDLTAILADVRATGRPKTLEYTTRFGGSARIVEATAAPFAGGHIVVVSRDISARKVAENDLRASQQRVQAMLDTVPDAISVSDRSGRILEFHMPSTAGAQLRSLDFVGRTYDEIFGAEEGARQRAHQARALRGDLVTVEFPYDLGEAGGERWFESRGVRLDHDRVLWLTRDITDVRAVHESLRESEEQYRNLVETASEGIMVLDADYCFSYVNRRAAELLGYEPDDLVGLPLHRLQPAREVAVQVARIERRRRGESERFEATLLRKDGSEVPVLVSTRPLNAPGGEFLGAFSMVADITDLVRAREAQQRTDERLRALVANLTDALLLLDDDARVVWASASTEEVIGVPPDALIGIDPLPGVPLDARHGWQWARAHPGVVSPSFERPRRGPDGVTRWYRGTYCDLRADAAVGGVLVTFRDVTAEHEAAEARVELLRRVGVAEDEERRRLAEGLHDGPIQELAALALRLGTLRVGLDDDTDRARRVQDIEAGIREAVGELRALMFDLQPPALGTRGLAASLRSCATMIFGDDSERVVVDDGLAAEPPAPTSAVAYRIAREALMNAHRHAHASVVLVRLHTANGSLTLTVDDDGVGIPDSSLHESAPGHLGVRTMRERAEAAGGRCDITRRDDGGTRVLVEVPLATPPRRER
jgi:PAS domain S-box-containing protein